MKRDLEPGCTSPYRGRTPEPVPIYWGKRKLRIAASKQIQVPGDRDLAYKNAKQSIAAIAEHPVRGPRTGCGAGSGHAAAGPEAGGFQTSGMADMSDAQPT